MQLAPQPTDSLSLKGQRAVERFADFVERRKTFVVLSYCVLFIASCLLEAATKLMWFDELATYYPAKLPSVQDLLSFFRDGIDVHTPTASLVLRYTIAIFGDHHATNRLPFTLGFLLMCVCIFVFVSRRCPSVYALAAMIFPVLSGVGYYATELRNYGLELGMTGVAMICWQSAAAGRRRAIAVPGLFLSLAIAISCHYYAAFIWVPFGLAELARLRADRRPDWPVWLALILSPAPLVYFLPYIRAAKAAYAAGIWSRPSPGMIVDTYRSIFTLAFAPILASAVLWILLSRFRAPAASDGNDPRLPERILAGSLALLPAIGVPLAYLSGGFVWRYVLASVAGLAVFLAFGLCRAMGRDKLAGSIVAVFFLGWFCFKTAGTVRRQEAEFGGLRQPIGEPYRQQSWMRELERTNLPVAAVPAVFFLQLQHYAPEELKPRIFYPASEPIALRFEGISTGETNLLRFAQRLPLRVIDYDAFAGANKHFLVCAETTNPTWLVEKLRTDGAQLRLLRRVDTHFVFDVTWPSLVSPATAKASYAHTGSLTY